MWPHHRDSFILLYLAVLTCGAKGLAAILSNEACSPDGPVLLTLVLLASGATSGSWEWPILLSVSMPPKGSSQWGP
jgi:hypothetical protein